MSRREKERRRQHDVDPQTKLLRITNWSKTLVRAEGPKVSRFKRRRDLAKARATKFAVKADHQRLHPLRVSERDELLAAARSINPAIRTIKGAKKLDRRLTRAATAGMKADKKKGAR